MKKTTLLILFSLVIAGGVYAQSAEYHSLTTGSWSNPDGDLWSNTENGAAVSAGDYPGKQDEAFIYNTHTVTLDINIDDNTGLYGLTVYSGGTLLSGGSNTINIASNKNLDIYGDATIGCVTFKNGASITIHSGGSLSTVTCCDMESGSIVAVDGGVYLDGDLYLDGDITGGGTIEIAATATIQSNTGTIYGVPATSIDVGQTITGYVWDNDTDENWNTDANWSQDIAPTLSTHDVLIPSGVTTYPVISTSGNVVKDVTVENGASLTIDPGADLAVNGDITSTSVENIIINSTLSGTGSLYHTSDNVQATIKRYISGNSNLEQNAYHTVSIPLDASNTNLYTDLFLESYLFRFNEDAGTNGEWYSYGTSTNTALSVNQGYMIYYPGTEKTYSFAGKLNNGLFSCSVDFTDGSHGFNLVPNPYSFDIDWNSTSGWSRTSIGNTIWIYNPAAQNYGAYVKDAGSGTNDVTNKIAVGQSFFVQASGSSPELSMTNAVKTTGATFLKNSTIYNNQLKISVVAGGYSDEAIVQFRYDGSFQVDPMNDAAKLYGAEFAPQLYTLAGAEKLSINSLPFTSTDVVVPMAVEYISNETCTLGFMDFESFDPTISIELEDKLTEEFINIRQNSVYSFEYNTNDNPERFALHFTSVSSIADDSELYANIYNHNEMIYITIPNVESEIALIEIFNISGQIVISKEIITRGKQAIDFNYPKGMYLVVLTTNNQITKKKIIN